MIQIPEFRAAFGLGGGHRQTIAAVYLRGIGLGRSDQKHHITLPDGDVMVLHDDCPDSWRPCAPVALLMHGLGGSHQSAYMVRIAGKLNAIGIRSFRLDHRGCGEGEHLSQFPYHAGRSEDAFEALSFIRNLCRGSLIGIAGFSLSANIILKLLGSDAHRRYLPSELACAVTVNPPLDLLRCNEELEKPSNRIYQNHFVSFLTKQVAERIVRFPDAPKPRYSTMPARLREFDDLYTAPASGFSGVHDYYSTCSGKLFVPAIEVPTLILSSRDDPLIPSETFDQLQYPAAVQVHLAESGGHMGYIGRRNFDPDRRWMDWRVVDWLSAHLRP
jgi:hypothetical protein